MDEAFGIEGIEAFQSTAEELGKMLIMDMVAGSAILPLPEELLVEMRKEGKIDDGEYPTVDCLGVKFIDSFGEPHMTLLPEHIVKRLMMHSMVWLKGRHEHEERKRG